MGADDDVAYIQEKHVSAQTTCEPDDDPLQDDQNSFRLVGADDFTPCTSATSTVSQPIIGRRQSCRAGFCRSSDAETENFEVFGSCPSDPLQFARGRSHMKRHTTSAEVINQEEVLRK